jgi:hypothetical protein
MAFKGKRREEYIKDEESEKDERDKKRGEGEKGEER